MISVSNQDNFYNDTFLKETIDASKNIKQCLTLRDKYMFNEHQDYKHIKDLIYKDDEENMKIDFNKIEIKNKTIDDFKLYVEDGIYVVEVEGKE